MGTNINEAIMPPADDPTQVPKITNYALWGDESDFTFESLQGKKLLLIIHDVEKTDLESYPELNSMIRALGYDVEVVAITASSGPQFEALRHQEQLAIPYYYSDKTLLKTMVRSNPGLVLMNNGTIKGKWHYNDIPAATDILEKVAQ